MEKLRFGIIMFDSLKEGNVLDKRFFDTPEELKKYVSSDEVKEKCKKAGYVKLKAIDEPEDNYTDSDLLCADFDANVWFDLNHIERSVDKLVNMELHGQNFEGPWEDLFNNLEFYYVLIIKRTDIVGCEFRQKMVDLAVANEMLRAYKSNAEVMKYFNGKEYKVEIGICLNMLGDYPDTQIYTKVISENDIREMTYAEFEEIIIPINILPLEEDENDDYREIQKLVEENDEMNGLLYYSFEDWFGYKEK